jgi:hypothetical protein
MRVRQKPQKRVGHPGLPSYAPSVELRSSCSDSMRSRPRSASRTETRKRGPRRSMSCPSLRGMLQIGLPPGTVAAQLVHAKKYTMDPGAVGPADRTGQFALSERQDIALGKAQDAQELDKRNQQLSGELVVMRQTNEGLGRGPARAGPKKKRARRAPQDRAPLTTTAGNSQSNLVTYFI